MMFMKYLLWLPDGWDPGTGTQGLAVRDSYPQLASRHWYPRCQQQPLTQHMTLLHVRGSRTAKPLDDIPLRKKTNQLAGHVPGCHPDCATLLQEGQQPREKELRIQKPCQWDMGSPE